MNNPASTRRWGLWSRTAFYTTGIALIATFLIHVISNGIGSLAEPSLLLFLVPLIAANLATWFLAVLAIRRTAEIGAVVWALFSPVLGLGLFGVFSAPLIDPGHTWIFGAISMIFTFWITWPVSVTCAVIVYRLVQSEAQSNPLKI